MTKVPEDEAVVEAGAGALGEAAAVGSVEDSEEAAEAQMVVDEATRPVVETPGARDLEMTWTGRQVE